MHKTIDDKDKIPGQAYNVMFVEINPIKIDISTVLSQNISNIPPNLVGVSNLAITPSNASKKKEKHIRITEIKIKSNELGNALKNMKKALNRPNIKPINVDKFADIFP